MSLKTVNHCHAVMEQKYPSILKKPRVHLRVLRDSVAINRYSANCRTYEATEYPVHEGRCVMKAVMVALGLLLMGCGSTPQPYVAKDYATGETKSTVVGAVMVRWEEGTRDPGSTAVVDGIRRELVYNGLSDSTVYVGYREYLAAGEPGTGFKPTPAFSSELKYSLRGNRTIVYQALRFEVEEVSSQGIRFRVLSDSAAPSAVAADSAARSVVSAPELFPR